MTSTRRQALQSAAGLAAACFSIGRARAAEFSFKVGTDIPEAAPLNVFLRQAADAVRTDTGGRVDLVLYPNNQLGGDPAMFSQFRSGALECFLLSGINVLSALIPKASIYGLGFVFKDDQAVYSALDGELGQALRQQIRQAGFVVMDRIWANGFRQVTSSTRPIKSVKDLEGFKIRVPVSNMWVSTFKSLGASPTTIPFSDVYSALQTKVVDGQETPLALIATAKLNEVQKYCAMTNHMWDGYWCLFSSAAWMSLPTDLQQIVARRLDEAALKERAAVADENRALEKELAGQGLAFNDVDQAAFRDKLRSAGYYAQWKKTFGDDLWALLEKSTGVLA